MALKSPQLRTFYKQLTRAEVNAGYICVPGAPGRIYTVVDAWVRAIGGAADTTTSVDVTNGSTIAVVFAVAALAQDAVVRAGAANTTATNLLAAMTQGTAIKVIKAGAAMGTATHVDVCIEYAVSSAQAA